ncbi:DUF255 domain-containing protein [Pontibacter sp. G13]|uniref:thioredoxin family protein n=1 Tax=Pontibacter sp. G13 TaxID=3074898 RepID=UPI00288AAFD1|nr:DUF255 domain-containing protein [Pontibacter sp. G13]WNJ19578.1 DUF255 domain-containing protein [Pontibacter sp. G13]
MNTFAKLLFGTLVAVVVIGTQSWTRFSASQPEAEINWISIEEAAELGSETPKLVFIDVYTDWCGWCKRMDRSTFRDPKVVEMMNKHYYAVKFNAEQKESITLGDKTFKFVPNGRRGYHELAAALLNGKMSYPTVVFLDENFNMIQPIPGYRQASEILPILAYFGENKHKEGVSFKAFEADFQKR